MSINELLHTDSSNGALAGDQLRTCLQEHMLSGLDIASSDQTMHAELREFSFAGAKLWQMRSGSLRAVRKHTANRGRPIPVAILQLKGQSNLYQRDRFCELKPGSFAYLDAAKPLVLEHISEFEQLYFQFPRGSISPGLLNNAVALAAGDDSVIDQPFMDCIKSVWNAARAMHPLQHSAAVSAIISLAKLTSAYSNNKSEPEHSARIQRAVTFIEDHLGDPRLNAQMVAERQGVSRRYLDELFAHSGDRVDAWIWSRRLTRAAEDLSCPDSRNRSLLQIALDLGFKTPSHFSRAFSQRHGVAPREYRNQHLKTPVKTTMRGSAPVGSDCRQDGTMRRLA